MKKICKETKMAMESRTSEQTDCYFVYLTKEGHPNPILEIWRGPGRGYSSH